MRIEEITQEIEVLQRDSRKNKRALCALAIALPLFACLAAAPKAHVAKTLKVRSLQIVDGKGKKRAELATDAAGGVALTMTPTARGTETVSVGVTPSRVGTLAIRTAPPTAESGDRSRVILTNNPQTGSGLFIIGKDGSSGLTFKNDARSNPTILMTDSKGKPRLGVGVDRENALRFALIGGKDCSGVAQINAGSDGVSSFSLRKTLSGEGRYSMFEIYANDPEDGSVLHITDKGGTERVNLSYSPESSSELRLLDASGQTKIGIGYAGDTSSIRFNGAEGKTRMAVTDTDGKGSKITWYGDKDEVTKTVAGDTTGDAKLPNKRSENACKGSKERTNASDSPSEQARS